MSNDECLACHNDATLTKDENGKQVSLHVDDGKFKGSVHSMFGCTDCHTDIKAFPHDPTPAKPKCATCHADQQKAYDHGVHAKAAAAGNTNVAKCQDCHGSVHEILPASDPKSKVARGNIPTTCGACHGQKFVMASQRHQCGAIPFLPAERARQSGGRRNRIRPRSVPTATVSTTSWRPPIPSRRSTSSTFRTPAPSATTTCKQEYVQSIHGQAIARGNWQAPVCTDCHGIHTIKAPNDPNSAVAAGNVQNTCGACHDSVKLSTEFGVPGRPRQLLSGQLSRHGVEGGFHHGGQLRQLPRRAQHSAVRRSALHHQPCQPGQDLRPVPSRRQREVHHQQGAPGRAGQGRFRQQAHRACSASSISG